MSVANQWRELQLSLRSLDVLFRYLRSSFMSKNFILLHKTAVVYNNFVDWLFVITFGQ
jgi:hypothetical protein